MSTTVETPEIPAPGTYYSALLMEAEHIENNITQAANALDRALCTRTYQDGYERKLCDAILADLDDETAERALWGLLCDHLGAEVMHVTCLLDNAAEGSYDVVTKAAKLVYDEIRKTRDVRGALATLALDEICDRRRTIDTLRRAGLESHYTQMA